MSLWRTKTRAEKWKGKCSELGLFAMLGDYSEGEESN